MRLPALVDYVQAVQAPQLAFADEVLQHGSPRRTPLGMPAVASGGFALTFDISVGQQRFAVRCFHKEGHHLQDRYARIAEFIRAHSRWPFLVDVEYIADGVCVAENTYPIVRMPWVAGSTLSDWVEDNIRSPQALRKIQYRIFKAVDTLNRAGVAHGDLQHGNILVRPDLSVQLIDYDGMYLPQLRDFGAAEQGHRHYQHPARIDAFDATIDAFSAAVLDLSLSALQQDPDLWTDFHNGENLVFTASDFADPGQSAIFDRIEKLPSLAKKTRLLRAASLADFADVPNVLYGDAAIGRTSGHRAGRRAEPAPVHAVHADLLRENQGEELTVFGRVQSTRIHRQTANVNFGDYRNSDFTIYAIEDALGELQDRFGSELSALNGMWVCLTGLIMLYPNRWNRRVQTPQIVLPRARALRVMSADQVEQYLTAEAGVKTQQKEEIDETPDVTQKDGDPTPESTRPEPGTPIRGGSGNVEERLGRLYSSANFGAEVTPHQDRQEHRTVSSSSSPRSPPTAPPDRHPQSSNPTPRNQPGKHSPIVPQPTRNTATNHGPENLSSTLRSSWGRVRNYFRRLL